MGLDVRSSAISSPGLCAGGSRNVLEEISQRDSSLQERVYKLQTVGCSKKSSQKRAFLEI